MFSSHNKQQRHHQLHFEKKTEANRNEINPEENFPYLSAKYISEKKAVSFVASFKASSKINHSNDWQFQRVFHKSSHKRPSHTREKCF
jgi:hypothetical protein